MSPDNQQPEVHVTRDGVRFLKSPAPCRQITDVPEYHFDDVLPGDRVIDIGANVGAFCIRAARRSQHVIAVEPVTTGLLLQNVALNRADVRVISGALGTGEPKEIAWDDCRVISPTFPLRKIREMAGGCDFLKCDCEGAEWSINPGELAGIRRIEMELHIPPICDPPTSGLLDYIGDNYTFTLDRLPVHAAFGVMGILHAARK
ncbi:MAG: FkbM family methyltransferase [Methanoregula sp.]|nr:FkbM family methyltransferase [Methanoregula sp.]